MYNSTLAKKFYKAFENYYYAALILKSHIDEKGLQDSIYPTAFLLRHSVELLLKSLICRYAPKQKIELSPKNTFIKTPNERFQLEGHSILKLYENFIKISSYNYAKSIFKDAELAKKIRNFDSKDRTSEYYRYPISSKTKSSRTEMFKPEEVDVIPDLGKNTDIMISVNDSRIYYIKGFDAEIEQNILNLLDIIDRLLVIKNSTMLKNNIL